MAPATKPGGSDDATPRYGNGNVKTYTDMGTENVEASVDTSADEIFRRCNNDMLNPMFTATKSKGSSGAPAHPLDNWPMFKKQAVPSLR